MSKSIKEILTELSHGDVKRHPELLMAPEDIKLRQAKQALYDLILSELMIGYVAADDLGNDSYKAQERLLNHQRHQLAQLFGREG